MKKLLFVPIFFLIIHSALWNWTWPSSAHLYRQSKFSSNVSGLAFLGPYVPVLLLFPAVSLIAANTRPPIRPLFMSAEPVENGRGSRMKKAKWMAVISNLSIGNSIRIAKWRQSWSIHMRLLRETAIDGIRNDFLCHDLWPFGCIDWYGIGAAREGERGLKCNKSHSFRNEIRNLREILMESFSYSCRRPSAISTVDPSA